MNRRRILIIDDVKVIGDACKLILEEKGFLCDHSLSGLTGLEMVLDNPYDLLILDMKLKDSDGMEILEKVKQVKPNLFVVVITGYSTVANTVKAMKIGANEYLSKPFTDNELIDAVEKVLN
jgi:DNA-binding NtrC family response regulator